MGDQLLVYGSYGYTGSLIARTAVDQGMEPGLAGRDAEQVERQALDLGCDGRTFSLRHPEVVTEAVADYDALVNCAGPFGETVKPLATACMRAGTDYLDIDGQIDVLEATAGQDEAAREAGVTLLPAVGFDAVPTDCLAAHLHERLPSATHLTLAIDGLGTFSPGTIKSIVEGLSLPGAVREDGHIRAVPAAWKTRRIDFGQGGKPAVTVPWGDVSTAYHATGIPNVETYAAVPGYAVRMLRWTRPLTPVLASDPVQAALERVADAVVSGPTPDERARSITRIWGEVTDEAGGRAVSRLRTPDTYDVTAQTAVEAARRVLDGEVDDGFQTPASAFGPDFVLEFDGMEREDVAEEAMVEAGSPAR